MAARDKIDGYVYSSSQAACDNNTTCIRNAKDALTDNVSNSTRLTIVSAFYGLDFIRSVLGAAPNRRLRSVTLIFAAASIGGLSTQIEDLKGLQNDLESSGYTRKRLDIRLATGMSFLHTKLYMFQTKSGHKRYLMGSANFSAAAFGTNDELLFMRKSSHAGLDAYISHALGRSSSVHRIVSRPSTALSDLIHFFREGFLYFKPSRLIPYTLNCFQSGDLRTLAEELEKSTRRTRLAFHDSPGIGSLNLARLMGDQPVDDVSQKSKGARVRISSYAVETAFGYWVPTAYHDQLEERIESASSARYEKLKAQGERLRSARDTVNLQIERYLASVDELLETEKLSRSQKGQISIYINRGLERLILNLTNERSLRRLSRPLVGAPVPEFWEDERSREVFIESFCEYVSFKLPSRLKIIVHLRTRFGLGVDDDPDAVRDSAARFFATGKTWPLLDWPNASDAEEDDDLSTYV